MTEVTCNNTIVVTADSIYTLNFDVLQLNVVDDYCSSTISQISNDGLSIMGRLVIKKKSLYATFTVLVVTGGTDAIAFCSLSSFNI